MMDNVDTTQFNAILNGRINAKMPNNSNIRDSNSKYGMSNSSNEISSDMNITFGNDQMEEHVGFVENS